MKGATLPIAILGAGFAGLTAASVLQRRGFDVVVFEAAERVSGLAFSERDADGFSHDVGAHFITNRLAAALGISAQCRGVARYRESVRLRGRDVAYPLGLIGKTAYFKSALAARTGRYAEPPRNAAEWFERRFGRALACDVALPLLEAWSGLPAERLSPAVGESLPSAARSAYLALASRVTGRPIACGYTRSAPETPSVWHVYPENGLSELCRRLAAPIGDCIETRASVDQVIVEGGAVRAVVVNGAQREVGGVVSTLPLDVLGTVTTGTDALRMLRRFRYRAMTFVNLRFHGRGLLPEVVTWAPERRFTFFRLTEVPCAMPWLAPEGKTSITADIGCEFGNATWNASPDEIAEAVLHELTELIPDARRRYIGAKVVHTRNAYPVFDLAYEDARLQLQSSLGVRGLVSVGRHGRFSHDFMEDVYWRTLHAMASFEASGREVTDIKSKPAIAAPRDAA